MSHTVYFWASEERTVKEMQEQISDANVQRHLLSLSVRNLDRKINIIIKSRKMQLEGRVEEDESEEQEVCVREPVRRSQLLTNHRPKTSVRRSIPIL